MNNFSEQIDFMIDPQNLALYSETWSRCGTFRVMRIIGGHIWQVFEYQPREQEYKLVNSFFTPWVDK